MRARPAHRGGVLLEVMVALAILLMAAMTIGGIVIDSINGMVQTRQTMQACDLARSTMAEIEAGLLDPTSLSGPIVRWDSSRLLMEMDQSPAGEGMESGPIGPGPAMPTNLGDQTEELWNVEVDTEPTEASGLFLVTVTAWLGTQADPDLQQASYTLRQVVRLGAEADDIAGEEDDLMDAARRGIGGGGVR